MKVRELAKFIAKKEGKKSNVAIGDIREIISILSDLFYSEWANTEIELLDTTALAIIQNGKKRSKKKGKK